MRSPDAPEEHETRYAERLERALRAGAGLSDEVLDTQTRSVILDAIVEDHAAKPIWLHDDFHIDTDQGSVFPGVSQSPGHRRTFVLSFVCLAVGRCRR